MINKEWQKDVNIRSKKYNRTLNLSMNQLVIKSTKQSNKICSFFYFDVSIIEMDVKCLRDSGVSVCSSCQSSYMSIQENRVMHLNI